MAAHGMPWACSLATISQVMHLRCSTTACRGKRGEVPGYDEMTCRLADSSAPNNEMETSDE